MERVIDLYIRVFCGCFCNDFDRKNSPCQLGTVGPRRVGALYRGNHSYGDHSPFLHWQLPIFEQERGEFGPDQIYHRLSALPGRLFAQYSDIGFLTERPYDALRGAVSAG